MNDMYKREFVVNVLTIICFVISTVQSTNLRPIIGILAQKTEDSKFGDTYIPASYVNYLQGSGARVVPIRAGRSQSYYEKAFYQINGVLFPGGGVSLITSGYAHSGRYMYDLAVEANIAGDYFPLWGTCLGFELLNSLTADKNLITATDSENLSLPLNIIEKHSGSSRLFGKLPTKIHDILTKQSVTFNNHHYSMTTKTFNQTQSLNTFYTVLSTNVGRGGIEFVSTFEAKKYPFYGTQWHPEKNNYNWSPKLGIDHSESAIEVSQYMSNFFVSEARKSNHKFKNSTLEISGMIDNYKRVYKSDGTFDVIYYFNLNSTNDPFI